jgi:hypothetical protein
MLAEPPPSPHCTYDAIPSFVKWCHDAWPTLNTGPPLELVIRKGSKPDRIPERDSHKNESRISSRKGSCL